MERWCVRWLVPFLYTWVGWEWTFYLTGAVGLLWLAAWKALYREPGDHPRLTAEERACIRAGRPAVVEAAPRCVPWIKLLGYRAVWAYVLASILAGPAWGFYQSFMPDFLNKRFGLGLTGTGVWTAVVIIGLAGSAHQGWSANLFSVVSDTMPKEAISLVVGLGGFVAYFTGGFVNRFTGLILEKTGSYVWVFAYFSMMYLLSLLVLQVLVPRIEVAKVRR